MAMYEAIIIYSSLIIPEQSSPGINIDVCLKPLIHELKLLWNGVVVFDAYSNEYSNMRATLRCTINDFLRTLCYPVGVLRARKHVLHVLIPHIHICLQVKFTIIILIVPKAIYLIGQRNLGML